MMFAAVFFHLSFARSKGPGKAKKGGFRKTSHHTCTHLFIRALYNFLNYYREVKGRSVCIDNHDELREICNLYAFHTKNPNPKYYRAGGRGTTLSCES